jgi:hypothetical protein
VELRYLEVSVDELWRRIQARGAEDPPISREDVQAWHQAIQVPDAAEMALYDDNRGR